MVKCSHQIIDGDLGPAKVVVSGIGAVPWSDAEVNPDEGRPDVCTENLRYSSYETDSRGTVG